MSIYSYFFPDSENDDNDAVMIDDKNDDKKYILQLQMELSDLRLQLIAENKHYTRQLNDASDAIDKLRIELTATNINYESLRSKYISILNKHKKIY